MQRAVAPCTCVQSTSNRTAILHEMLCAPFERSTWLQGLATTCEARHVSLHIDMQVHSHPVTLETRLPRTSVCREQAAPHELTEASSHKPLSCGATCPMAMCS